MMSKLCLVSALLGLCVASYSSGSDSHSIELPVKSKHNLDVIHTPSEESDHQTHVDVPGGILPVYLTFKTQSSPLYVKQQHQGAKGSVQKSDSKDEAHQLYHEVIKPVYQEIKEVIQPYRKVIQIIQAVNEERLTKVHKGEGKKKYEEKKYGQNMYEQDKKYGESQMDKKYEMRLGDLKYGDDVDKYVKVLDKKYKDDVYEAINMYKD